MKNEYQNDFINFLKAVDELKAINENDKQNKNKTNISDLMNEAKKEKKQEYYEDFISDYILKALLDILLDLEETEERKEDVSKKNDIKDKFMSENKVKDKHYIKNVEFIYNDEIAYVYFTDGSVLEVGNFDKDREKAIYIALSAKLLAEKGYDINKELDRYI